MAKKQTETEPKTHFTPAANAPPPAAPQAAAEPTEDVAAIDRLKSIPAYRKCPLCFEGEGGVGRCYSTHGTKRYYKCHQCGHSWTHFIDPKKS